MSCGHCDDDSKHGHDHKHCNDANCGCDHDHCCSDKGDCGCDHHHEAKKTSTGTKDVKVDLDDDSDLGDVDLDTDM